MGLWTHQKTKPPPPGSPCETIWTRLLSQEGKIILGDYTFDRDDEIKKLVDCYEKVCQSSLKGASQSIKERIMAHALESHGMLLLEKHREVCWGDIEVERINTKGERTRLWNGYDDDWQITGVNHYRYSIPLEFVDELCTMNTQSLYVMHNRYPQSASKVNKYMIATDLKPSAVYKAALFCWEESVK